ncbi:alpha/beta hydrolase-fold protein [Massilia endophytica]|uniref:alpha/beta hydrolase-fold protein n=1 Tax=Massilia endophytica TaxID=2899220 RepID=UPI001E38E712|nr:alpha/beta hydrolase-fold protein [Massilia endophytica]UGQ45382.1 esterase [Massilia endophytica]
MNRLTQMMMLAGLLSCTGHAAAQAMQFGAFGKQESVNIASPDPAAPLRSYTHSTSMALREGDPQSVTYAERADLPRVRSGFLPFDGLFALAVNEMKQDSVSAIRDGSYNGGQPIPCECFETGEKWNYVWTRDLSYAAHLGLGMLDPKRVRNSLLFKLSGYREGAAKPPEAAGTADGLQIIQDTGSGGSWPVSTDRVSWAFGADEALKALPANERAAFAATALKALVNTIENDRIAAYDAADGLYRGEQSFLDWRDQTYASWIPGDLASMASSKALSTNVGHYKALTLAAQLAQEAGDTAVAERYKGWAAALKLAINAGFWLNDAGMYSSLTAGHFDGAPLHKFDWLGQSLAIVTGVADAEQARSIMAHYPHGPMGAPVIWPQQQDMPVYHNRAIWPFVTAYGLKAAAMTRNVLVADAAYETLLRGAAVSASNMENLEWLSGQTVLHFPGKAALDGPVVNSRRQLWSVGGYLGAVIGTMFGISTTTDGIDIKPFITSRLRGGLFQGSEAIVLDQLVLQGKRLRVKIALPPAENRAGYYFVQGVAQNGKPLNMPAKWSEIADDSQIEVTLGQLMPGRQEITRIGAPVLEQDSTVFAPHEPVIASLKRVGGKPVLAISGKEPLAAGTVLPDRGRIAYNIYRDGKLVAERISGSSWTDLTPALGNACYAAEAVFTDSGNRSHHSAPVCLDQGIATGGSETVQLAQAGRYAVQALYRNTAHQINLGITNGVKWLRVRDASGATVAEGVVQMPHSPADAKQPSYSTPLYAQLKPGRYTLQMSDFYNMSYLQSNAAYADAGGKSGARNRTDLHGYRLMPLAAQEAPAASNGTVKIVDGFRSPQLGNERKLRIYLPPGYEANAGKRYPVLYMHDGQNLFDARSAAYGVEWNIDEVADRLIASGKMKEVIVVGIDNTPDRISEYTPCCDLFVGGGKLDDYARFIVETVKPWADKEFRTLPDRGNTAIMGSSLGGIASVYIAQRYPQVFSKAGGVSSSFWWNQRAFVSSPPPHLPVQFYIDAGNAADGIEDTKLFRDAMLKQGYQQGKDLYYYEDEGGIHNEQSWASRVHLPLLWFFSKNAPPK